MDSQTYKPRQWNLSGLKGISDKTLEMHFKLYEGYVKETNRLNEQIAEIIKDGKVDQDEMPAYSELTRRLDQMVSELATHALSQPGVDGLHFISFRKDAGIAKLCTRLGIPPRVERETNGYSASVAV